MPPSGCTGLRTSGGILDSQTRIALLDITPAIESARLVEASIRIRNCFCFSTKDP